ncbi:MAG: TMEM175 family protein [Bilifractor sp.]|jgi:uncharacterized membrane protein
MSKGRLEAFSDGVLAIIITIMVLEMSAPEGNTWSALSGLAPTFFGYLISYTYIGIYWVNHHRLIVSAKEVSGKMLWANLLWMFCVSLIPFATSWTSNEGFGGVPGLLYSIILFLSAIAYHILVLSVCRANGQKETLIGVLFRDRRSSSTILAYAVAMPLSYYLPVITYILYVVVAISWIVPDIGNKEKDTDKDN